MYYYAQISAIGYVMRVHALDAPSTNENYIEITEDQYTNGNLVGRYYNKLTKEFTLIENGMYLGSDNEIRHKLTFMPLSTRVDNLYYDINQRAKLDHTHTEYAETAHTHSEYATSTHTHDDYATVIALDTLDTKVDGKADATHTHDEYALSSHEHDNYAISNHDHDTIYAPISHSHNDYVTTTDFNTLETEVNGKANENHIHSNYSEITHNHDDDYSSISHTHTASEIGAAVSEHNHDSEYSDINHNHDNVYATVSHDHDEDYSAIDHNHNDVYATTTALTELSTTVSGKANISHTHNDIYYTETEIDTKLADKADSNHNHTGVYDVSGAAANALTSANTYTDNEIDALSETVATKANASDLTSHTGNTTVHITNTERTNWNAAKTHANSTHAPSNAEENQNAFSNVVVGSTTISADTKTDTLTLVAGNNVTITPDSTGDSITISSANTVYTHPTSAGNKHIPAGGSSGQILRWSADGTAVWGADNNTTYSVATQTSNGLMSAVDKGKLDSVAEGANNYVLPSAGTSLGGVKTGGDVTISSGVITVNDDSHNHVISNVDGLQSVLDGKAASGHTHDDDYYTETEVDTLLSGKANSSHTHTISNITNLQSTLDGKAATSHGTHVSFSTTAPVMDGSASVGTATTVARSDHKHPIDTSRAAQTSLDSHTGNKSNPHSVTLAQLGLTATAAELNKMDGVTATTAELNILDGITATTAELNYVDGVTSNIQTQLNGKAASGHTHGAATTSAAGFMTAAMVTKLNGIATGANAYAHPTYTARTGVPTANQTPAFGGTFTVSQPVSDGTGHITAVNSRTITIPNAVVTTSANGLMSASDKSKLDGIVLATVSEVETYLAI